MHFKQIALALAALVLGSYAASGACAQETDSQPWPLDGQGHPITGTAFYVVDINHRGVLVAMCLERSTGDFRLDRIARDRLLQRKFTPNLIKGWPIQTRARVPVVLSAPSQPPPPEVPHPDAAGCNTLRLPNMPDSDFMLDAPRTSIMHPDTHNKLAMGEQSPAWPAKEGHLNSLDVPGIVLVGPDGKVMEARLTRAGVNPQFELAASYQMQRMDFGPQQETHWAVVDISFRSDPNSNRIAPYPPPPTAQQAPTGPQDQSSVLIRESRVQGKTLADDKDWPRLPNGSYAMAILRGKVWVDADGKCSKTSFDESAKDSPFIQEAYALVNKHREAPSAEAHWASLTVGFWPVPDQKIEYDQLGGHN